MKEDHQNEAEAKTSGNACRFAESAAAYVQQELTEAEARAFEAHRQDCPECRRLEADFRQVLGRLAAKPAAAVSRDLTDDIMRRISEEESEVGAQTPNRRLVLQPVVLSAAAAALVAMGISALWLVRIQEPASLPPVAVSKPAPKAAAAGSAAPIFIAKTEVRNEAISGAVKWLTSVQEPSGAWAPATWGGKKEYEVSLTSLAIMAIRRGDSKSESPESAQAVKRAVAYLVTQQNPDGSFGPEGTGKMYNHGITTVALLGLPGRDSDPALRAVIDKALAYIRSQQHESGGWGYEKKPGSQANTSISVWQLEALLQARSAGWKDSAATLGRGLGWLRSMVDEQGTFGYQAVRDGQTEDNTLTAMGARCLFMADTSAVAPGALNARIRGALRQMAIQTEQGQDFYRSYFLASALNAGSTGEYGTLLANLQDALIRERSPARETTGSWDPVGRWSNVGGRLYTTTMATLSLEEGPAAAPAL